jgi:hypothetical protein
MENDNDRSRQQKKMSRRMLLTTMGIAGAALVSGGAVHALGESGTNEDDCCDCDEIAFVVKPAATVTEYSAILNNAFQNYGTILIKNGTYPVDATLMQSLKSDTCIWFEPDAWLKVLPNSLDRYELLDLTNVENVYIYNPNLEGDKYEHTGTTGQWGHGINIVDSTNVRIYSPRSRKFWGDGLYIKGSKDIEIHNGLFDDNRRQGISIISGENLYLYRPICSNTGGQAPGAGIDIESNFVGEYLRNVNIYEPRMIRNALTQVHDHGIVISLKRHYSTTVKTDVSINIYNPVCEECSMSIETRQGSQGTINIVRPVIRNARKNGLYLLNCDSDDLDITIEQPRIYNPNHSGTPGIYSNGIALEATVAPSAGFLGMRNISIINPVLRNEGNDCYAIRVIGAHEHTLQNCKIEFPDIEGIFSQSFSAYYGGLYSPIDSSFVYRFDDRDHPRPIANGGSVSYDFRQTDVVYQGSEATGGIVYVNDLLPATGVEFRLENQSQLNQPLHIHFGTSGGFSEKVVHPLGSVPVKGLMLPTKFSWVKLIKLSATEFVIVQSSGNVTAIT